MYVDYLISGEAVDLIVASGHGRHTTTGGGGGGGGGGDDLHQEAMGLRNEVSSSALRVSLFVTGYIT